jgi:hypothetical protein
MDLNEGGRREAAFLWSAQGVMSLHGTKRTSRDVRSLVAIGGKADMAVTSADFRV